MRGKQRWEYPQGPRRCTKGEAPTPRPSRRGSPFARVTHQALLASSRVLASHASRACLIVRASGKQAGAIPKLRYRPTDEGAAPWQRSQPMTFRRELRSKSGRTTSRTGPKASRLSGSKETASVFAAVPTAWSFRFPSTATTFAIPAVGTRVPREPRRRRPEPGRAGRREVGGQRPRPGRDL